MNIIRVLKLKQMQESEHTLTDTQRVIMNFIYTLNIVIDEEKYKFYDSTGGMFFIFCNSEFVYGYRVYKMFHDDYGMEFRDIQNDISFIVKIYLGLNSIVVKSTNLKSLSIYK